MRRLGVEVAMVSGSLLSREPGTEARVGSQTS